jgi:FkbM family methyltransferase
MPDDTLIYDVGAHKGEDAEFYLKKGFSVVAIEATPQLCELIEERLLSFVKSQRLKILNLAVSSVAGSIDFYIDTKHAVWNTSNQSWVERNKLSPASGAIAKINVDSLPLCELFRKHGTPRYCKIDIEGCDLDAIKSLVGLADLPRFISIESETREWSKPIDELLTLRELGYSRYKLVDQSTVEFQECPAQASEGAYCQHSFADGSSGLFGNELPGRWLNLPEAIEAYRNVFLTYALNGDTGIFANQKGVLNVFSLLGRVQAKAAQMRGLLRYSNPAGGFPLAGWYDTHAARAG